MSESFFLLADAQSSLNSYLSRLEADPVRLDFLQQRKSGFVALVKKFGSGNSVDVEIEALQLRFKNSSEAIADLEGGDARLQELEKELTVVKKTLLAEAKKISELRTTAAQKLSTLVTQEIQQLSMPHATFVAKVESCDYSAPKESEESGNIEVVLVDEIGDRIAESLVAYFSDENSLVLLKRLIEKGLQFEVIEVENNNLSDKLEGKAFVISGVFEKHSRDDYKKMIEENGGKNVSSVSSKTNYLLAGDNMGPSKKVKAEKLGIQILDETAFLALLKE